MLEIVNDFTKFTEVTEDWTSTILKHQDRVSRLVENLCKTGVISDDQRSKLKDSGSKPGRLYGLPKVHKTRINVAFRPILSTIGTYNHNLSKFLVSLLSDTCQSEYCIRDSLSFASSVSILRNENLFMASFDITSLFSNIPIDETVELILGKFFGTYKGFTRTHFKKQLNLCTKDNLFVFNG